MLFKGIGRTFSTENNRQYETIGAFWDELAAKYGRANLQGLGYGWTDRTIEYAIGLIYGEIDGADRTVKLPETGWATVRGRTADLGEIYEKIYREGSLKYEIERFTDNGECEIMYCREKRMIILPVDQTNILQAATIHAISWKESHRAFCAPDFIEKHTPARQREYLRSKMSSGTKVFMLLDEKPVGIVSVTGSLIEDLYVLPNLQNRGYGTELLRFAMRQCKDTPVLWILENNIDAERLYRRMGFQETGRRNSITDGLDEIEFHRPCSNVDIDA